jgi:pyruvate,water dikinase
MGPYVLDLQEIDQTRIDAVGGKGANLGELSRIEGVDVPPGFCVTTAAFRRALEGFAIPDDVAATIRESVARFGEGVAFAVRSSATAEDLPNASFAGQHDSYLNVVGSDAVLEHVRRCWASLFTARAVAYRAHHGFGDRRVHMAVVIQRMVPARAAGVLFTADPVSSNRKIVSVEANFGLGEALVSGRVNPDVYRVRGGEILSMSIVGTRPALTEAQVVRLAELGRRIEAHFGRPQDIEWCLLGDGFQIVQSRAITTLFPIPATRDEDNRVYLSVGHAQMMTDAMKPLGLSLFRLTTAAPMVEAGGRLFVDATDRLASPTSRAALLEVMGRSDPLTRDALQTILDRGDFIRSRPDDASAAALPRPGPPPLETDASIVADLMARTRSSIARLKADIQAKSGPALLDFILADLQELRRLLFDPRSHQVFMSAMEATWWLDDQLDAWLGEKNVADVLTLSAPGNVTSEMGFTLLDVADVIRPHPHVVSFLERVQDQTFLDSLGEIEGGRPARDAIEGYLEAYGMRCAGEIDITRPRWTERPATLLPMILGHVRSFEPGAGKRRFEEGRQRASRKKQEVLERVRALPDGATKAEQVEQKIDRVRTFIGYREFPKYGMICRYFVYKQALLQEAARLVQRHVLREAEEVFYLTFQELQDVVRTNRLDDRLIGQRKKEFDSHRALTPPRVLTSDGEVLSGAYRRADLPHGALPGVAVSAGVVEGRARVVLDVADASFEAGDILVTPHTDPSWTPVFLAVAGLVTEVGGLMTHGAVIAREYGLPAVVAVDQATRRIRDGRRIRVDGTNGYVELLPPND